MSLTRVSSSWGGIRKERFLPSSRRSLSFTIDNTVPHVEECVVFFVRLPLSHHSPGFIRRHSQQYITIHGSIPVHLPSMTMPCNIHDPASCIIYNRPVILVKLGIFLSARNESLPEDGSTRYICAKDTGEITRKQGVGATPSNPVKRTRVPKTWSTRDPRQPRHTVSDPQ